MKVKTLVKLMDSLEKINIYFGCASASYYVYDLLDKNNQFHNMEITHIFTYQNRLNIYVD